MTVVVFESSVVHPTHPLYGLRKHTFTKANADIYLITNADTYFGK